MRRVKTGQKAFALFLCVALIFTMNSYRDIAFAEADTVTMHVGVPGINVTLKSADLPESYSEVTDERGDVQFDDLYDYLVSEFHWDGSEPESMEEPYVPDITEITISYDVNYADVSTMRKETKENGNGRYEGTKGTFILSMNEPESDLDPEPTIPVYQYTDTVPLEEPESVDFLSGKVTMYGYNEDPSSARGKSSISVESYNDENTICGVQSDADGNFEFFPYIRKDGVDDRMIYVPETLTYYGYEKTQQAFLEEDQGIIRLKEKFTASLDNDFSYGDGIKFGYVKEAGDYEIIASEGKKLSLSADGPFEESILLTVNEFGAVPDFYVQNEEGDVSKPVSGLLQLDTEGPVISKVDGVNETEGTEINFNVFGIFTNTDADLTIRLTVRDTGCGVEKLYMTGKNPDEVIVKYDSLSSSKGEGTMTATFLIPSTEELLEQELTITAVDYLGNESDFSLIRETSEQSTITIEKNPPQMTDISISGKASSYGWYNDAVGFSFSVMDREAGLKEVEATINGFSMISQSFPDSRERDTKNYSFTLSRELISSLETADGSYTVVVAAKDNCGNKISKTVTVKADIVSPYVTISGVTAGMYYQQAPVLTIHNSEKYASQAGAYIHVTVYRNDASVYSGSYAGASSASLSKEFAADGQYRVTAYAVDAAGNISNTAEASFTVDATAPVITPGGVMNAVPSEFGWYNQPLNYEITVEDVTSGIAVNTVTVNGKEVPYDGQSIQITKELIEEVINDEGTYTIIVKSLDKAGNESIYQDVLKIDIVNPNLTLSGIDEDRHYNTTPTLTIDSDEKHFAEEGAYMKITIQRDGQVVSEKMYPSENQVVLDSFNVDGDYLVTAEAMDAALNSAEVKTITFVKDTTAPVISISGAAEDKYYNTEKKISIQIDERYYKTDDVKIEVTRSLDGKTTKVNFPWKNKGEESINSQTFSQTGTYSIKVTATDEAGNKAKSKALKFTVDTVAPQVEISGITNDKIYTYDDTVAPVLSYSDSYYSSKQVTVTRAGVNWYGNLSKADSGSRITFSDFQKVKKNDGVYHIEITVTDKAGNSTTKKVDFAVNRFGSTFSYDQSVTDINGQYVKEVPQSLIINERNISTLENSVNEIKHDGQSIEGNATTRYVESSEGYNLYEHAFPAENFMEEGVYQINVLSEDKAGNKMESQEDVGQVKFFVDKTPPVINVDGLNDAFVNAESLMITATASDNLAPVELSAAVNGEMVEPQVGENGEISLTLSEGLSQEVCITAVDAAGNSEVFAKTVNVTPNPILYFVLRYKVAIATSAAVLAALIVLAVAGKRRKIKNSGSGAE